MPARRPPAIWPDELRQRTGVADTSLDALGNMLGRRGGVGDRLLTAGIAVRSPASHGTGRAHPSICLPHRALDQFQLTGRLVDPGEGIAQHHGVSSGGERLDDVTRCHDPTVGDDSHTMVSSRRCALVYGGELRHTGSRDDARGADRPSADANLHGVGTSIHQGLDAVAGHDVPADNADSGPFLLHIRHGVHNTPTVPMGGVYYEHVDPSFGQRLGPIHRVGHANGCTTRRRPSLSSVESGF